MMMTMMMIIMMMVIGTHTQLASVRNFLRTPNNGVTLFHSGSGPPVPCSEFRVFGLSAAEAALGTCLTLGTQSSLCVVAENHEAHSAHHRPTLPR